MSPRTILFFALPLLTIGCAGPKTDVSNMEAPAAPRRTLVSETDTFYGGRELMCVSDTTKEFFDTHFKALNTDTSEARQLIASKGTVTRNGDTLTFNLGSGKVKQLVSTHYTEGSDDFTEYKYLGRLPGIPYHVVFAQMYEAFAYLAVNTESGKSTWMCGYPAVSHNRKYLASSSFDLQSGFVFNGLQMYDVAADSLTPVWSRELSKWGADRIVWTDDHHLAAEKMELDSAQNVHTSYIRIACCGK